MRYVWIITALYYDYNEKLVSAECGKGAFTSYQSAKDELWGIAEDMKKDRGISPIWDTADFGAEARIDLYYAGAARRYATLRVQRLILD